MSDVPGEVGLKRPVVCRPSSPSRPFSLFLLVPVTVQVIPTGPDMGDGLFFGQFHCPGQVPSALVLNEQETESPDHFERPTKDRRPESVFRYQYM